MSNRTDRMTTTLLSLAMARRLDAIIDMARDTDGDAPYALTTYGQVIDWALDLTCELGTAAQWTHASREELHTTANLGPLTLVEIESGALRAIEGALARAQGIVLYTPTPSTAIAWLLDVARSAGYPAPGE